MKHVRPLLLIIGMTLCLFSMGTAQEKVFKVSCPSEVAVGQRFQVSFSLETTEKVSDFKVPVFRNANIVFGPSQGQSSSYSNVNGKITRSHTISFTYYLVAPAEGSVVIPSASVSAGGKTYHSEQRTIKVVKDLPQNNPQIPTGTSRRNTSASSQSTTQTIDESNLFLRAIPSRTKMMKGEEVIVSYRLYTNVGVAECRITRLPAYKGFWTEDLPSSDHLGTEVVNGKQYDVFELHRIAAYPQTDGSLTIDPMEIEVNVLTVSRSNSFFDSFFGGGYQKVPKKLKSDKINFTVNPLPTPPEGFNEAVGDFKITSLIDSSSIRAGEPFTIKYTVSGKGNLQLINDLETHFPSDFEVYAPKTSDNLTRGRQGISGSKTFEYILIPRIQGQYTIKPATLTFFNPNTQTYETIASDPYSVGVKKGSGEPSATAVFLSEKEKYRNRDIEYLLLPKNGIRNFAFWIASPWYWVGIGAMVVIFVVFFLVSRHRSMIRKDVSRIRWQRSHRMAKKRMAVAKKNLQKGNRELFYSSVSTAIWGYLADKYNIDFSQLSIENVQSILMEKGIKEDAVRSIVETLEHCEYARFAPSDGTDQMNKMYEDALELIAHVESQQK